jgi:hypothetical protein
MKDHMGRDSRASARQLMLSWGSVSVPTELAGFCVYVPASASGTCKRRQYGECDKKSVQQGRGPLPTPKGARRFAAAHPGLSRRPGWSPATAPVQVLVANLVVSRRK